MQYHLNVNYTIQEWDPKKDYPANEYIQVYFRLNQKVYEWGRGWTGIMSKEDYYNAVEAFFRSIGFIILSSRWGADCPTAYKGKEHIYLHPMDFSGVVLKTSVGKIAEALESTDKNLFDCRFVDLYHTIYDIGEYEYTAYLDGQCEKIDNLLLEAATTKRSNLYKNRWDVINSVAGEVALHRIDKTENYELCQDTQSFVRGRIVALQKKGYIIVGMENDHIRAANKTEMKKLLRTA